MWNREEKAARRSVIKPNAAVAAAKSLQSCPTLCDPKDGSPPGPAVPGILQARTLEWVAISSSNAWKWKVRVKSLSRVRLLATPWTAAHQAPPSMGFSRQEYWSGLPWQLGLDLHRTWHIFSWFCVSTSAVSFLRMLLPAPLLAPSRRWRCGWVCVLWVDYQSFNQSREGEKQRCIYTYISTYVLPLRLFPENVSIL